MPLYHALDRMTAEEGIWLGHRTIFYYDSRSNLTCVRDDDLGLT